MPIYEYQCRQCQKCFERLQLPDEEQSAVKCPKYGAREPKRLMRCVSFMGSGIGGLCTKGAGGVFS
jgi:putative FmdB family regulatory protein